MIWKKLYVGDFARHLLTLQIIRINNEFEFYCIDTDLEKITRNYRKKLGLQSNFFFTRRKSICAKHRPSSMKDFFQDFIRPFLI